MGKNKKKTYNECICLTHKKQGLSPYLAVLNNITLGTTVSVYNGPISALELWQADGLGVDLVKTCEKIQCM